MLQNTPLQASLEVQHLPPPEGVLPNSGLMGMSRWMGSHFHHWIDYYGVAFLRELLEWGRTFLGIWGSENSGR